MAPTQKPCNKHISILHQAIRKYGIDSFSICQIEECDDKDLDVRERYWIEFYRSYENGYNIYKSSSQYKKCTNEELLELWNDGMSIKEIGEKLCVHSSTVAHRLKNIGISEQQILDRGNQIANMKKIMPVYQYDIDGYYVNGFSSLREAQESIGGRRIKFPPSMKGQTICGYQWRKFKTDKIESVRREKKGYIKKGRFHREVVRISKDGKDIRIYYSIKEAAEDNNVAIPNIIKACSKEGRTSAGYLWEYADKQTELRKEGKPL